MISHIKKKLRKFIIRYHLNEMIKGSIIALTGLLALFLLVVAAEYFGYFSSGIRKILTFTYLAFAAVVLYRFVFRALLKIYGVSKPMTDMEASRYIGKYMPEVSDKLTNLLQLSSINDFKDSEKDFLNKAIEQKASELRPFNFPSIIDFKVNKKYLKYLAAPALVFFALALSYPGVITEPARRLATYNREYEKPQPFYIHLENDNLEVVEGDNLSLAVKVTGDKAPDKLYYESGNERYRLKQKDNSTYSLTLKNLRRDRKFVITDGIIQSTEYGITVRRKPEIIGYEISLNYPAYTDKQDEKVENNGDLVVPCGTEIQWSFKTRNTREVDILFNKDEKVSLKDRFTTTKTALEDFNYRLVTRNEFVRSEDTLAFTVDVTPDQHPEIELSVIDDSSSTARTFFNGFIGDDYGFSKMVFAWKHKENEKYHQERLNVEHNIRKQAFYFSFRKDTIVKPGDEIEYFFEIWDNDQVKGPKSTRTSIQVLKEPSEEEIEEKINEQAKNFRETAKKTSSEIKKMNEEFDELRMKLINKENLDWDDKEAIRQMLEKSDELRQQVEKLQKNLDEKSKQEEKLREKREEILEKEKRLEELMDKLFDEELLKKIEELKKHLEKENKDKIRQSLEEMNQENMDLEKELERNLELFKRLEVEKELQDAIDKMQKLKNKQEEAIDSPKKEKAQEQEKINREFDDIRKDFEELRNKDKDLEDPMGVENTSEKEEQVQQELEQAGEKLQQGKNKKGTQNQKQAKQEMQELIDQLQQMQQQMQQQSAGEDMGAIRELLENIVRLSVEQEKLMEQFSETSKDDPRFVDLINEQKDMKEDLGKVKDSLYALSKRQLMIRSFINKEVSDIDRNMGKAMESMLALNTIGYTRPRDRNEAVKRQQYVMKGLNNIALMLSESLEQMKQQMRNQMKKSGNKSCNNPKQGEGGTKSLQQMQNELNKMLDQMKNDMEGGKKQGSNGQRGKSDSERFARAAAKQREIRKQLEELRKEMQSQGNPAEKSIGETLEQMDETEEDLVNKILNENIIKRQQEILSRLLEHEKAKREQEYEKKRKAEKAKNDKSSNPAEFLEYKRLKEKEAELLRTVPPELAPFYKNKLNEYYINLGR